MDEKKATKIYDQFQETEVHGITYSLVRMRRAGQIEVVR